MRNFLFIGSILVLLLSPSLQAQKKIPIEKGWSSTSINAVVFRKNSLVTHDDIQYASFYDVDGRVILAKRELPFLEWEIQKTRYQGNVEDAHNSISIMVDGNGFLHMAWDHHGNALNYVRSTTPGSLVMTDRLTMTGLEENITYPEFFKLPEGDLLLFYRSGSSGRGNLVINRYDIQTESWKRVQDVLISGEDERNAYWQGFVDQSGTIHVSWVWRETWDVATNHDMSYAKSEDGGKTWINSNRVPYELPITLESAEVVVEIPQSSELINQTSMYADENGWPYIATYWKEAEDKAPQFHVIFQNEKGWHQSQVGLRTLDFSLSGGGTKKIPISRPQVVVDSKENPRIHVIYRDAERSNRITVSSAEITETYPWKWATMDLTNSSVGSWEPTFDTERWKSDKELHLFVQKVGQGDGEKKEIMTPQMVYVLVWNP